MSETMAPDGESDPVCPGCGLTPKVSRQPSSAGARPPCPRCAQPPDSAEPSLELDWGGRPSPTPEAALPLELRLLPQGRGRGWSLTLAAALGASALLWRPAQHALWPWLLAPLLLATGIHLATRTTHGLIRSLLACVGLVALLANVHRPFLGLLAEPVTMGAMGLALLGGLSLAVGVLALFGAALWGLHGRTLLEQG